MTVCTIACSDIMAVGPQNGVPPLPPLLNLLAKELPRELKMSVAVALSVGLEGVAAVAIANAAVHHHPTAHIHGVQGVAIETEAKAVHDHNHARAQVVLAVPPAPDHVADLGAQDRKAILANIL